MQDSVSCRDLHIKYVIGHKQELPSFVLTLALTNFTNLPLPPLRKQYKGCIESAYTREFEML